MLYKFWLALMLATAPSALSAQISIIARNDSALTLIRRLERCTDFNFCYTKSAIKRMGLLNFSVRDATIEQVLDNMIANGGVAYTIVDNVVVLVEKPETTTGKVRVSGTVITETGEPLEGVTVMAFPSRKGTATLKDGNFTLSGIDDSDIVIVSSTGYEARRVKPRNGEQLNILLHPKVNQLDELKLIGYGSTTQRFITGSVSKVRGEDIQRFPLSNPLLALDGRMPGLEVNLPTGVPGSAASFQIRGQSSVAQSSAPLVLIDGVPLPYGRIAAGILSSAAGDPTLAGDATKGIGIFNGIPPGAIESMDVLKDADATAIYGSKGANGVILITTKKGKAGKPRFNMQLQAGAGNTGNRLKLMDTRQYLKMRRDALANDGLTPSNDPTDPGYAPDITILDTTRHTNWKRSLTGHIAALLNAQLSASGGDKNMQYFASADYHRESAAFPGDFYNERKSLFVKLTNNSINDKFRLSISVLVSGNTTRLPTSDPTQGIFFVPNGPAPYDSSGHLVWSEKGVSVSNPFSPLLEIYNANTTNILWSIQPSYQLLTGLRLKLNLGSNYLITHESSSHPIASQDPALSPTGSSFSGYSYSKGWIAEPQLEYTRSFGLLSVNLLAGSSWQDQHDEALLIEASGYANDALLQSQGAALIVNNTNNANDYRYNGLFGRINMRLHDRYILNLTGRRDGSSRFGPNNRFGNFGSAAMAWIFTGERGMKEALPFLSFGKLRMSYGSTGNDKIGDNMYLGNWGSTSVPQAYAGIPGLQPIRLANPDFKWEINRKFEMGIELGVNKDKVIFNATYFRNRSSSQLVNYPLAAQTGFNSIDPKNLDAVVANSGLELSMNANSIKRKNFSWSTTVQVTMPRNQLVSFPGLANSFYNFLTAGYPLSIQRGYRSLGVDPANGTFIMDDLNKDGRISSPEDLIIIGNLDPKLYGSISNTVQWKHIEVNVLVTAKIQQGVNPFYYSYNRGMPGQLLEDWRSNQPRAIFNYWQQPGNDAIFQKPGASPASATQTAATNFSQSDQQLVDASHIRVKWISVAYKIHAGAARSKKPEIKFSLQACNLITLTHYQGNDPDIQDPNRLPPVRSIVAGIEINF